MSAEERRSPVYALGSVALVGALVLALWLAWNGNTQANGYFALGQANSLLQQSRYSDAQALLEDALKTFRGPQVRLSLSYAYLARRDAELAERQANLALTDATPPLRPLILAQLGRVLRFEGRDSDALIAWGQAEQEAALFPESAQIRLAARSSMWQAAMTLWAESNWPGARLILQRLISGAEASDIYGRSAAVKLAQLLAPDDPAGSLSMEAIAKASIVETQSAIPDLRVPGLSEGLAAGVISGTLATLDNARAQVGQAVAAGANEAAIDTLWGGMYLQQGENGLAKGVLERIPPGYAPAETRLALVLFGAGDIAGAQALLQRSMAEDGSDPLTRHVLARLYTAQGQWVLAKEQLDTLNKLEPDGIETHLEWAEFYRLQGDYDNAEEQYISAANAQIVANTLSGIAPELQGVDNSTSNAVLILARFYTDVRSLGCVKGLPSARQVIALEPNDPASFDAVGWSLVQCGEASQALSTLEGAVERAPDVPRYRLHLGKAYGDLGRYADARDQYNRVRDLDPGGPWERLATAAIVNLSQ